MSSFKDMVSADNLTLLNTNEFAELRTIIYDGETYQDIPIIFSGLKEQNRHQLQNDYVEGLYLVTSVLHVAIESLDGVQPEKGRKIRINDEEGGGGFFRSFYIASSNCEMGMLRLGLEAIDE